MQTIFDTIAERQAEMAELPRNVKLWVSFMRLWFFSGIVFVWWWKPARWIVLTMVMTAIAIIASKIVLPDFDTIMAGSIIQLILWIPLAIYLLKIAFQTTIRSLLDSRISHKLFGFWCSVATLLVLISTALNIYNVAN